jgi:outer membrane protein
MLRKTLLLIIASFSAICSQAQGEWTLQQCIDHAFQQNIQIRQGELNMQNSEVNRMQTRASTLPAVNGSFSHGYNWGQTIDPFTNQFATERIRSNSLGVNASLLLFNGFQQMNSINQAEIDLDARTQDLERIKNDVALNVANAFLNVLFTQEFEKIARSNFDNTNQQVERIRKLVDAGSVARGTLFDMEAQLASDEASVIAAENNVILAYLNLTQLLQIPSNEAKSFKISAPDLSNMDDVQLVANPDVVAQAALNSFPQIKSAELDVMSAHKSLSIAQGTRSPRFSVSFSYGTGYSGANQIATDSLNLGYLPIGQVSGTGELVNTLNEQIFPSTFKTKSFGDQLSDNINRSLFFTMSIPIFNGFSSKASVQRAQIGIKNAELNLENTKNQLDQSVQRAYTDALAALRNYKASEKSVTAAQEAMDYAKVRYEAGAINAVDYTASRVRLDNSRADLIRNKFDYLFKTKVVDFYLGKPITFR